MGPAGLLDLAYNLGVNTVLWDVLSSFLSMYGLPPRYLLKHVTHFPELLGVLFFSF